MITDRNIPYLDQILAVGESSLTIEQKEGLAREIMEVYPRDAVEMTLQLVREAHARGEGLVAANQCLESVQQEIELERKEASCSGIFVGSVVTSDGIRARVQTGNLTRYVRLAKHIEMDFLDIGSEVLLSTSQGTIIDVLDSPEPGTGEISSFEYQVDDSRIALKVRDAIHIVLVADSLALILPTLKKGDLIRWNSIANIAYERVENHEASHYLLEDIPTDLDRSSIGGHKAKLEEVIEILSMAFDPEEASLYDFTNQNSILLTGVSGIGKTLMLRIAASILTRLKGVPVKIAIIKPSEWESPWVGETQNNIRNLFAELAKAAESAFVVAYFDEAEAFARSRGISGNVHSDKFLNALLVELDGFKRRGNVAIVTATNRKDLVDSAMLQRLSDFEIALDRPTMSDAREIFAVHLKETLPYSPNGASAAQTRQEIIEVAVSRFYSEGPEAELCILKFRDGKTRTVFAKEMASGRTFAQVCKSAKLKAWKRKRAGGDPGLQVRDIENAVSECIERLSTTLTPVNCHEHLADLPKDMDVVDVTPVVRRVTRPQRFFAVS